MKTDFKPYYDIVQHQDVGESLITGWVRGDDEPLVLKYIDPADSSEGKEAKWVPMLMFAPDYEVVAKRLCDE